MCTLIRNVINKNLHVGNDCKKFYLRFKKVNKKKNLM